MKSLKWIIPIVLVLAILLIPLPMRMKDGGSVTYAAIAYQVTDYHRLTEENGVHGYTDGWRVDIFGITVYEQIEFVPEAAQ